MELVSGTEAKITTVGIDEVHPNPWNPNVQSAFMFERERASIREFGFVDPVTVRVVPGEVGYQIVDGEHRWRAAKAEGHLEIAVVSLGTIPDHVAKRLTVVLNETRGEADRLKLGELVSSLMVEDPKFLDVLPYDSQQLKKLTAIMDFDLSSLEKQPVIADPSALPELAGPTPEDTAAPSSEEEMIQRLRFNMQAESMLVVQRAVALARERAGSKTDTDAVITICESYVRAVEGVA